jgi:hypothetical protein
MGDSYQSETYIRKKAQHAEEIAAAILQENETLRSFVTGAWVDKAGKALIEDVMYVDLTKINNLDQKIKYKVRGNKDFTSASLRTFFAEMDKLNNTSASITLDDELYEILREASVLNIQSKSGLS